jgi:hypothetical protein
MDMSSSYSISNSSLDESYDELYKHVKLNLLLLASKIKSRKKGTSVMVHTVRGFCRTPRVCQVMSRLEEAIVAVGQRNATGNMARRQIDRGKVRHSQSRRRQRWLDLPRGRAWDSHVEARRRWIYSGTSPMGTNRRSNGAGGEMREGEGAGMGEFS